MSNVTIRQLLERLGYKNLPSEAFFVYIDLWRRWYQGKTAFHKYQIYNGNKTLDCERKTLGMAKKISEDKADLLLNEKVLISADKDNQALQDTLIANNFWAQGNRLVEKAHALGTGAFIEYLEMSPENKSRVLIDYIDDAGRIWPLSWSNGTITECAFASVAMSATEGKFYNLSLHLLENSKYVVYNYRYDEQGREVELPAGVLPRWTADSERPTFQIVKPNISNNFEEDNPMGISLYANSIDLLQVLDAVYDSYYNEFLLGRKRIFADASMLNVSVDPVSGAMKPVFDPRDTVFYNYPNMNAEKGQPILESNMELRVDEHSRALQDSLDLLSENAGFGKGYYKFSVDQVQTATGVMAQNSKLFRKIRKEEILLKSVLIDMSKAILMLLGLSADQNISVSFDDSIIEDTNAKTNRALLEREAGVIDDVMYFMDTRALSYEAAQKLVDEISARQSKVAIEDAHEEAQIIEITGEAEAKVAARGGGAKRGNRPKSGVDLSYLKRGGSTPAIPVPTKNPGGQQISF